MSAVDKVLKIAKRFEKLAQLSDSNGFDDVMNNVDNNLLKSAKKFERILKRANK